MARDHHKMWRVIPVTVTGESHLKKGVENQDYIAYLTGPDYVAVVVADGVGGVSLGGRGAMFAVRSATKFLRKSLLRRGTINHWQLRKLFVFVRNSMRRKANDIGVPPEELSTTLLVVVANNNSLMFGHVGDGGIVCIRADGGLLTCSQPVFGKYINEIVALPAKIALERPWFRRGRFSLDYPQKIRGFAVFTDGIQKIALHYPAFNPEKKFFDPFFQGVDKLLEKGWTEEKIAEEIEKRLIKPDIRAKTDDDLSLVIVSRCEPSQVKEKQKNEPLEKSNIKGPKFYATKRFL